MHGDREPTFRSVLKSVFSEKGRGGPSPPLNRGHLTFSSYFICPYDTLAGDTRSPWDLRPPLTDESPAPATVIDACAENSLESSWCQQHPRDSSSVRTGLLLLPAVAFTPACVLRGSSCWATEPIAVRFETTNLV